MTDLTRGSALLRDATSARSAYVEAVSNLAGATSVEVEQKVWRDVRRARRRYVEASRAWGAFCLHLATIGPSESVALWESIVCDEAADARAVAATENGELRSSAGSGSGPRVRDASARGRSGGADAPRVRDESRPRFAHIVTQTTPTTIFSDRSRPSRPAIRGDVSEIQDAPRSRAEMDAPTEERARIIARPAALAQVDAVALERLRSGLAPSLEEDEVRARRLEAHERKLLISLREQLGEVPRELHSQTEAAAEVLLLDRATQTDNLEVWATLPREANRLLTAWATARSRVAQAYLESLDAPDSALTERLALIFPRLSRHSKDSQPGTVHGLAKKHEPRHASWIDDALDYQAEIDDLLSDEPASVQTTHNVDDLLRDLTERVRDGIAVDELRLRVGLMLERGVAADEKRLLNLLAPYEDELEGEPFANVKRALVRARREREAIDSAEREDANSAVPADWPYWSYVERKVAVIVGGDPRPERRERIREAFRFAEVEWLPDATRGTRQAQALTQRMQAGSVDLVIVLRAFTSHKVSDMLFGVRDPACTRVLADSYGVTQILLGIERSFRRHLEADTSDDRLDEEE